MARTTAVQYSVQIVYTRVNSAVVNMLEATGRYNYGTTAWASERSNTSGKRRRADIYDIVGVANNPLSLSQRKPASYIIAALA